MKQLPVQSFEQENWLELGLLLFAGGLITGIVALLYGRALGSTGQARQHRRAAPAAGSIPYERHENIDSVATR